MTRNNNSGPRSVSSCSRKVTREQNAMVFECAHYQTRGMCGLVNYLYEKILPSTYRQWSMIVFQCLMGRCFLIGSGHDTIEFSPVVFYLLHENNFRCHEFITDRMNIILFFLRPLIFITVFYFSIFQFFSKFWKLFYNFLVRYRAACHRTDKAERFRRDGIGAVGIIDAKAPRWVVTTCVAANHPGHPSRRRLVLPANHRQPVGPWRPRPLSGRRSSADNPPPKRSWSPEDSGDKCVFRSWPSARQGFLFHVARSFPGSAFRGYIGDTFPNTGGFIFSFCVNNEKTTMWFYTRN